MRALVISGGGCKGAWAGGYAQYLVEEVKREYDVFVGTSTGSLLVPLIAAGEIERIKHVYCNVDQSSVFDRCPFTVREVNGQLKTRIHHLNVLRQFIDRRKTFGESRNLLELIRDTLTPKIFEKIGHPRAYVVVTVANLTHNVVEYKYSRDCEYDDFCEWIWASANTIPFMSLLEKNGYQYADGGLGNIVPIQEAINLGATEIDAIVLNTRHRAGLHPHSTNAFNLMVRGIQFMIRQMQENDVRIALLESRYSDVNVNIIHTPTALTENAFVFKPEQMARWWNEGFRHAERTMSDLLSSRSSS